MRASRGGVHSTSGIDSPVPCCATDHGGVSKGVGFVRFEFTKSAHAAIKALKNKVWVCCDIWLQLHRVLMSHCALVDHGLQRVAIEDIVGTLLHAACRAFVTPQFRATCVDLVL